MPRKARIDAPEALHHIIRRGIERRNIFRDDTDRNRFVGRIAKLPAETATPFLPGLGSHPTRWRNPGWAGRRSAGLSEGADGLFRTTDCPLKNGNPQNQTRPSFHFIQWLSFQGSDLSRIPK